VIVAKKHKEFLKSKILFSPLIIGYENSVTKNVLNINKKNLF
jgi:hypothetical protein